MSLKVFEAGVLALLNGSKAWATDTVKLRLVMSNTTVDTQNTAIADLADFTTIDACDSANYGGDKTITCGAVVKEYVSGVGRVRFPATDVTWSALAACTRQIVGGLLYWDGASEGDRIPIAYQHRANPITPIGADVPWGFPSSGAWYLTNARGANNRIIHLEGLYQMLTGGIDFSADTIKGQLLMANTTADSEDDGIEFLADFTTLDRCDGANHGTGVTLGTKAIVKDDTNQRITFGAANLTFTNLGAGTRNNVGLMICKHVTNDADSIPICTLIAEDEAIGNGSDYYWTFVDGLLSAINCPRA